MCMPRTLTAAFLTLGLLLCLGTATGRADDQAKSQHSAVKPVPREGGPAKRHEVLVERAKKGNIRVMFLGDSITQGWEGSGKEAWTEHFAPLKAGNFGIGGDRTQHVLWRITEGKELEGIDPELVVLMIGTNNLGGAPGKTRDGELAEKGGNTVDEIVDGVQAIVKELRKREPQAAILLLAIFPRAEKPDAPARMKIQQINEKVAKLADGKQIRYLDIGKVFLSDDGTLTADIMPDYLHLSKQGYQRWAKAILPTVQEMLKSTSKN